MNDQSISAGMTSPQVAPDQSFYDDMARVREQSAVAIDDLERRLAEQRRLNTAACKACAVFEHEDQPSEAFATGKAGRFE